MTPNGSRPGQKVQKYPARSGRLRLPSSDRIVLVASVAVTAAIVLYAAFVLTSGSGTVSSPPSSFTVNGKTYAFTYVATTDAQRTAGLMDKSITNETTMLFAFPSFGTYSFWMYQTNTSLDMIWVNGTSGSVVYLVTAAQPCLPPSGDSGACTVYTPTAEADYVIEAKAGFAAANGVVLGTIIQFG